MTIYTTLYSAGKPGHTLCYSGSLCILYGLLSSTFTLSPLAHSGVIVASQPMAHSLQAPTQKQVKDRDSPCRQKSPLPWWLQMMSLVGCGWLLLVAEAVGTKDRDPVGWAWGLTICQALAKEGIRVSDSCWSRLAAEHFGEPACQSKLTLCP